MRILKSKKIGIYIHHYFECCGECGHGSDVSSICKYNV